MLGFNKGFRAEFSRVGETLNPKTVRCCGRGCGGGGTVGRQEHPVSEPLLAPGRWQPRRGQLQAGRLQRVRARPPLFNNLWLFCAARHRWGGLLSIAVAPFDLFSKFTVRSLTLDWFVLRVYALRVCPIGPCRGYIHGEVLDAPQLTPHQPPQQTTIPVAKPWYSKYCTRSLHNATYGCCSGYVPSSTPFMSGRRWWGGLILRPLTLSAGCERGANEAIPAKAARDMASARRLFSLSDEWVGCKKSE
eukprot:1184890-Prorocentrum_minimum.AAC.3